MEVTIKHFSDQFNILLHSAPGVDPFLEIKGCRIVQGEKGDFISYPATKNQSTGKYWKHVYGGEKFNEHVLTLAKKSAPQRSMQEPPRRPPPPRRQDDSDVPF